jgi:hypothetical protein
MQSSGNRENHKRFLRYSVQVHLCILPILGFMFLWGCASVKPPAAEKLAPLVLQRMGYSVQTGAFSRVDNAARMTRDLQNKGVEAYYFRHESGLYKVRFGNYRSLSDAVRAAMEYRQKGVIGDYYIVKPDEYPAITGQGIDQNRLRTGLVVSAKRFIGVPYRWGGVSDRSGFDCSGLTMAVYQLNGVTLPRTSEAQWETGAPVSQKDLSEGDLVFFSTKRNGDISHVGIYIGNGEFIHAPGKGKEITIESLSSSYFQRRYVGGRAYIG